MNKPLAKVSFLFVAFVWGISFAFQKGPIMEIGAVSFTFWNFFVSGVIFLVYGLSKHVNMLNRWREGVFLGLLLSGVEIFQMIGLQYSSISNTAFLSNIGMLLIPFCGWLLFGHRITRQNVLAVILAIVGMYYLVGGLSKFGLGELALLVSAISIALYFAYSEQYESSGKSHLIALCTQQFLVISAVCLISSVFSHESFVIPHAYYSVLAWQILVFTTIPYLLVQWASRYSDELVATFYDGVVEPLVGGIVAWVIFAEATSPLQVAGGLLMVFAFAFGEIFTRRHFLKDIFSKFYE